MLKIFLVIALLSANVSMYCTKTIHFQKYVPSIEDKYELKNLNDFSTKHRPAQSIDFNLHSANNDQNARKNYIQRLIQEAKHIHSPNPHRKIKFRKLIKDADYLNYNPSELSDEERLAIDNAIEHNFINLLKRVYAITSRSRYGR